MVRGGRDPSLWRTSNAGEIRQSKCLMLFISAWISWGFCKGCINNAELTASQKAADITTSLVQNRERDSAQVLNPSPVNIPPVLTGDYSQTSGVFKGPLISMQWFKHALIYYAEIKRTSTCWKSIMHVFPRLCKPIGLSVFVPSLSLCISVGFSFLLCIDFTPINIQLSFWSLFPQIFWEWFVLFIYLFTGIK